jgi:lipopolysaccharide transport system ATP-binding protein
MSEYAIQLNNVGKLYRLYPTPRDKIFHVFGLEKILYWKKNNFQDLWVLRNINLNIRKGERIGIIGRNGAGKSTLLKLISGNITPTEGTISVNGKIQAILELGTAFHPEFTGRENIRASLTYQGYSKERIREKEEEIIEFAELDDFIDQPLKTYSSGMYARLAFSVATIIEPEILIIDEILSVGDAYFNGKSLERMRSLTEKNHSTILFVSHDLSGIQQLCNHVIWIEKGRIIFEGAPLDVIKAYTATIRKEEDLRLRAKELKIQKKQIAYLEQDNDLYSRWLFHFMCQSDRDKYGKIKIFQLSLFINNELIGSIDLGQPMDNSQEQLHHILDNPGFTSWGSPQKESKLSYREFDEIRGKYRHAPFVFSIPRSYDVLNEIVEVQISYASEMDFALELFWDKHYVPLGILQSQKYATVSLKWSVPDTLSPVIASSKNSTPETTGSEDTRETIPSVLVDKSEYGSGEVKITGVYLHDHDGKESRIFETGSSMRVIIEYSATKPVVNPYFVFCIYMPDGRCASQWICSTEKMNVRELSGKGRFVFSVENLQIGQGAYIASAAIFKYLNSDGHEAESYHLLDRSIHFQIVQRIGDWIERGLCIQTFHSEIIPYE